MPRYSPEDYDALLAMLRQRQGTPGNSRFDIEELDIAPLNIPWDLRAGLPQAPQQSAPVYPSSQGGQMPGVQALAPQSAPMPASGDPYAGTPAPRPSSPGVPSASYRLPNQDWTQVPLDQSGQPMGTPGNRPPMAEEQQQQTPPQQAPQSSAPQAPPPQMGAAPQVPNAQQAMNYLHRLGYDTSNPAVARMVPQAQQTLYKQAMDQYKSNLSIANTQSEMAARTAATERANNPKPTEGQSNAALYADRMREADTIIAGPKATEAGTSAMQRGLGAIPLVGNYLVSEDKQQLEQAKSDFVNAVLRRESGAVISEQEFKRADKQYFPQPGDSPKVIEQKAQNRATALAGVEAASGRKGAAGGAQQPAASPSRIRTYNPATGRLE